MSWTYVSGGIRVELDLGKFEKNLKKAQRWLGDRVLEDCKPFMPILTGSLQQRSHTEDEGKRVVFPGPYARYLYMGKVMVDSVTGKGPRKIPMGPGGDYILRFTKGSTLTPTGRNLAYSNPAATAAWFETAKARYKTYWIEGAKKILTGGGNV